MPKLLIYKNFYIYLVFAVDILENRKHIHVAKKSVKSFKPAKIWLEPKIELVKSGDFKPTEIKEIVEIATKYHDLLLKQIDKFFNNEVIEVIKL